MMRTEYPRPQFQREHWQSLNGEWSFSFDDQNIGLRECWYKKPQDFKKKIQVPFAYQTKLSGIQDSTFHDVVWYHRQVSIPKEWDKRRIILHFGAVDYRAHVFVNGELAGTHEGGHTSFSFDITHLINNQEASIVVRAEDPSTDETIPRGKQYWVEESDSIWYTRTTGIWQPVWLEPVSYASIEKVRMTPDVDYGDIEFVFDFSPESLKKKLTIKIKYKGDLVCEDTCLIMETRMKRRINIFGEHIFNTNFHHDGRTWTPENPNLFDVTFILYDQDQISDQVNSYFGMRKVHSEDGMIYLNNKPYYQKLVLDQGYWREGLLTAPTDEDLKKDILLAKEMGFNGCRKHQKVEDPRFLYWADQLGYLVWGECAAAAFYSEKAACRLTAEWTEIIERDYNHPSIVAWVPLNESWGVPYIRSNQQQQHHSQAMYYYIHSLDGTRPVISNDGWELTVTDICAIHNYNHGTVVEEAKYLQFKEDLATKENLLSSQPAKRKIYANGFQHRGEPIILTEFGGIGYKVGDNAGWGYTSVANAEEFIKDYSRVMKAVYSSKALHGYCYTQLTDVEQEINGLLTYDRNPKCELSLIRNINDSWHDEIKNK
ncbi:glycoside hydrolase family 2 (plasmid) [Bacillus thuringiensis serovar coreanensis]|uniref:glycoside hydrolase family 2 protein n=1 Tax=Bacillus thuringiensis TaxID=1428 RepID=UPI0007F08BCA|nr:glycoside hydrolase family 2 [Bacillus thuringiensis serovar coreanensis]MED1305210.1 glycoside hydrolase family 2 TIM barrel-domain containing protein [Bacillus pacificus]